MNDGSITMGFVIIVFFMYWKREFKIVKGDSNCFLGREINKGKDESFFWDLLILILGSEIFFNIVIRMQSSWLNRKRLNIILSRKSVLTRFFELI